MTAASVSGRLAPLVVVDADVLGRERTGDETYVHNLLRRMPAAADGALTIAAITRRPELVPPGVETIALRGRSQELRMAWALPRLLHRLRPALAHFQHSLPLRSPCPAVVTVHDLSFERDARVMGRWDRFVFRSVVPRSVRAAARVCAVSERTKRDLVELYGIDARKVVVTPNAVDPAFTVTRAPDDVAHDGYLLFVGAIQERKNPLAAADAAREVGMPLVVAGPEKEPALARELEARGAELRGYVDKPALAELYRRSACVVLPSRYEGFGLPVLEAMACGTAVVATNDEAMREVGGDAAVYADERELAQGIRRALSERDARVEAGFERVQLFSWDETARRVVAAYREVLGV